MTTMTHIKLPFALAIRFYELGAMSAFRSGHNRVANKREAPARALSLSPRVQPPLQGQVPNFSASLLTFMKVRVDSIIPYLGL